MEDDVKSDALSWEDAAYCTDVFGLCSMLQKICGSARKSVAWPAELGSFQIWPLKWCVCVRVWC